jgi:hypothetical protein
MSGSKPTTSQLKIEFPFRLDSTLDEIVISDDLHVRRMNGEDKERLLHLKDAEYDKSGRLSKFTALEGCLLFELNVTSLDIDDQFCSSNYVLAASSRERAGLFNLALKLAGNSCSSLYIGYGPDKSVRLLSPPCYFGQSALALTKKEASSLVQLVKQISDAQGDSKLTTMSDIFLHAMALSPRKESRFIEVAILMEMLLLPSSSQELSFRFALRLAKLMQKLFGKSPSEVFAHGKSIYTTRSNLVHTGKDRNLERIAPVAYDYARSLLSAYTADKTLFQDAALDALCIA